MTIILRLIGLAIAFWAIVKILFSRMRKTRLKKNPVMELRRDPVCGIFLPEDQAITLSRGGKRYYFCSEKCRDTFEGK